MEDKPLLRQATPVDASLVSSILTETATWLIESGQPLWCHRALQNQPEWSGESSRSICSTASNDFDQLRAMSPSDINISEYTIAHYERVLALMQSTPGVAVRDVDSCEAMERYLMRNPGLSFIAESEGLIIGLAMCGHDGRRGYLQHVVVEPNFRGQGIAHALVNKCLDGLESIGIMKTHIDVFITNDLGNQYWRRRGWQKRDDIYRYSMNRSNNINA